MEELTVKSDKEKCRFHVLIIGYDKFFVPPPKENNHR
jgi:hypothetical protein